MANSNPQDRSGDNRRVINFPDKDWRDQFHAIRKSTDPVDFAISSDNKSLMKEVDRRTDASRAAKSNSLVSKVGRTLGIIE